MAVNLDGIERWELLWDNVPPAVEQGNRAETTARLAQRGLTPDLTRFAYPELLPKELRLQPTGPKIGRNVHAIGRSRWTADGWKID